MTMTEHRPLHSVTADEHATRPHLGFDEEYRSLVLDRIEERGKDVRLEVGARVQDLAARLREDAASARDVADLHLETVTHLTRGRGQLRVQAVVLASQLVLIELLGHLSDQYRDRALADRRSGLG